VAAFYGPTDMLWTYDHPDNMLIMDSRLVQRDFLGGAPTEVPERYNAESPLFHVTSETVPTLLVHGKLDAHVYYEQSVRLAKKLDEYKVKNVLLSLPWATHGCEYNLNGPSGQLAMYAVERFLYAVTKSKP
jgi:acetyl esterase/lipase